MTAGRQPLFRGNVVQLSKVLERWRNQSFQAVLALTPDDVVRLTNEILTERILSQHCDTAPEIASWSARQRQFINEFGSAVVEFVYAAKVMSGNAGLLDLRLPGMVHANAFRQGDEIVAVVAQDGRAVDVLRAELQATALHVETNLRVLAEAIDGERDQLRSELAHRIGEMRAMFQAGDRVFQELALPVWRDEEPPASPLRIEQRVLTHRAEVADSRTLESTAYEEIVDACSSMANTIKRSPRTFGKFWSQAKTPAIQETPFRDVFLVGLNASFKGLATGETFNFRGKTDITIRVADRNLFIAEFKVWSGPASYTGAVEQVLDYVSWDDTKACVVMFVGRQNYTEALSKIVDTTRSHSLCDVVTEVQDDGQWIRWIAHHPQDAHRRVTIVLVRLERDNHRLYTTEPAGGSP